MAAKSVHNNSVDPAVRGYLHAAIGKSKGSLVFTHGAGGDCNNLLLVALADAISAQGVNVLRCDLPFRQKKPTGPPSPSGTAMDQQGLANAVAYVKQEFGGKVFVGGQSYGGRQATMLAASDPKIADGLLLTSYPLHPPGKPQQLRTAHFPGLKIPALFIQGTKDPFATPDELEQALKLIPVKTDRLVIEKAGHSLVTKRDAEKVTAQIAERFLAFISKQ
jgi:predicted alpha/beta-hydrolase family hydrolase